MSKLIDWVEGSNFSHDEGVIPAGSPPLTIATILLVPVLRTSPKNFTGGISLLKVFSIFVFWFFILAEELFIEIFISGLYP